MSGQAPLLIADKLVAEYEPGLPIVNGASIHVNAGEIVAVLGPNGAGKSTLVKAIAGLIPISGGPSDITTKLALLTLLIDGAFDPWTTVSVKLCVASAPMPLCAVKVIG